MSQLRVKIILNEGGEGVPLSQLSDIADEAEKFLRYLAEDSGIVARRADWLARNFRNESVRFDVERESSITIDQVKEFNTRFEYVNRLKSERRPLNGVVSHRTLVQFTKIAGPLGPHEKIAFGLYRPEEEEPYRLIPLTKRDAEIMGSQLAEEVTYRGSLQGEMHNVGVEELWFQLRLARSRELVRCNFREPLYEQVIEACKQRHARIYVHGMITARRIDREISSIVVEKIKAAPILTEARYQAFFGADPNYTGDLTSEDFAERSTRYEH